MIVQRMVNATVSSPGDSMFAMAFSQVIVYQDVNGISGYDPGVDTVLKNYSLLQDANFAGVVNTTTAFDVTFSTDATTGASVVTVLSCDSTAKFCFSFTTANSSFFLNGAPYFPLESNVVLTINLTQLAVPANARVAVLAYSLSGASAQTTQDLHSVVDLAVNYSFASNTAASCSPDVVIPFANSAQSGYVNWNRTAVGTSTANLKQVAITVTASSFNANQAMAAGINTSDGSSMDSNLTALNPNSKSYFVFSFVDSLAEFNQLSWDPEVGSDVVSTQNLVVFTPLKGNPTFLQVLGTLIGEVFAILISILLVIAAFFSISFYLKKKAEMAADPELEVVTGPLISETPNQMYPYPEEEPSYQPPSQTSSNWNPHQSAYSQSAQWIPVKSPHGSQASVGRTSPVHYGNQSYQNHY
jgi:hypothetical protein